MLSTIDHMNRYRRKKAKPGQLMVYFGKLPHDDPDVIFAWGEGVSQCDGGLANHVFCGKRLRPAYGDEREKVGLQYIYDKSFIDELTEQGYDISTLRFSIEKKK